MPKKSKVVFWRKDELVVCSPCCQVEMQSNSWLAAHAWCDDLIGTCTKCKKKFELGKIPNPPRG